MAISKKDFIIMLVITILNVFSLVYSYYNEMPINIWQILAISTLFIYWIIKGVKNNGKR